jgi:hypothetical protein
MSLWFDRVAAVVGRDVFVHCIEDALAGDDKETFLSPP